MKPPRKQWKKQKKQAFTPKESNIIEKAKEEITNLSLDEIIGILKLDVIKKARNLIFELNKQGFYFPLVEHIKMNNTFNFFNEALKSLNSDLIRSISKTERMKHAKKIDNSLLNEFILHDRIIEIRANAKMTVTFANRLKLEIQTLKETIILKIIEQLRQIFFHRKVSKVADEITAYQSLKHLETAFHNLNSNLAIAIIENEETRMKAKEKVV